MKGNPPTPILIGPVLPCGFAFKIVKLKFSNYITGHLKSALHLVLGVKGVLKEEALHLIIDFGSYFFFLLLLIPLRDIKKGGEETLKNI